MNRPFLFLRNGLNLRFVLFHYGCILNSLPCAFNPKNGKRFRGPRSGGGFCEAKDGGIVGYGVTVAVIIIKLKTQSLSRLRRQLPLHKGAYI